MLARDRLRRTMEKRMLKTLSAEGSARCTDRSHSAERRQTSEAHHGHRLAANTELTSTICPHGKEEYTTNSIRENSTRCCACCVRLPGAGLPYPYCAPGLVYSLPHQCLMTESTSSHPQGLVCTWESTLVVTARHSTAPSSRCHCSITQHSIGLGKPCVLLPHLNTMLCWI